MAAMAKLLLRLVAFQMRFSMRIFFSFFFYYRVINYITIVEYCVTGLKIEKLGNELIRAWSAINHTFYNINGTCK